MIFILGSGPSSIAAAAALVHRGLQVTMIDPGKTLEPERQAVLDRLAGQPPEEWNSQDLAALKNSHKSSHGKIHSKLIYGSDFPYSDCGESLQDNAEESSFHYSMARGGLSTVWGAALSPYCAKDIEDWPIELKDLEPHYRAVLKFVPSTGAVDSLEQILPAYTDQLDPLLPSRQACDFLADIRSHHEKLAKAGITCGESRLAIAASGDSKRHACVYCGLCLYGCPYSLIYSSATTLDQLLETGKVHYIKDHVVERLEQDGDRVTLHARSALTSNLVEFHAERVFVGCGILPTAYLVLNSLGAFNTPIEIIDSQYFIYPFLRFKGVPGVKDEKLYGASQITIEINDPWVSDNLVHIQSYGYSEFIRKAMFQTPLRFILSNRWISDQVFGRLFLLQGFIHSKDSSRLSLELHKETAAARPMLRVNPLPRLHSFWTALKAGAKLLANSLPLGGIPILPAIQFAGPGRSYHSGGTFPMSANPTKFQTDTLGRLPGMDRVHLIDASVFPSIPGTTITLTTMANAHRIASQAADL